MADTKRGKSPSPMQSLRPPPISGPSYAEGEIIPPYVYNKDVPGPAPPPPPPAAAYPGDAKNVAPQFHSSQFDTSPVLSSSNMNPQRYAPATGFGAVLNNRMNLAPSTELNKGGGVGYAKGGSVKSGWRKYGW